MAKVTGAACFVHDLTLPEMVHGWVVRPPTYNAQLVSVDETAVLQMPGVLKVVRDGSFLAVLAEREEQAVWAAEALAQKAVWEDKTALPPMAEMYNHLLSQPSQDTLVVNGRAVNDPIPPLEAPADAVQTLSATYYRPYQMHGSLAPSAAMAQLVEGNLTVWSHSQGVTLLQKTLAQVLGMNPADIHLIHTEGSGCYGHNGADDAALDAALLARAIPGRPVSLKGQREDEHG
jgi:xanthine dehydrogenase molybdopterin-binding subunit B